MGGAESQALQLARLLSEGGRYEPHIACLEKRGVLLPIAEKLGLPEIEEFSLRSFHDVNAARQLVRFSCFLRRRRIDILHTEGFYTNVFGLLGAALAGTAVRIGFRGETTGWRSSRQNQMERIAFWTATMVHANSLAVKRQLVDEGVPEKRIKVIYNGLDLARVTTNPGDRPEDIRAKFGFRQQHLVTIIANMHHPVKDHETFLRSAREVFLRLSDVAFAIAGEGRLQPGLEALASELGIGAVTHFLGSCDNIADLLSVSSVCVLSSKAEGFSNSILEYMAAGRPVVATDAGGAREAILDGETGYIVRIGDHASMASRIVDLLCSPELCSQMGLRARQRVIERFSSDAQLANTERLYDQLLVP
jgi:glycosyltransferase involved in cell wall biosynthesis